ncbi:OmpH family outer membrane protein [bacterium]|nr:OmpH family outer membrane protein [bacterium]
MFKRSRILVVILILVLTVSAGVFAQLKIAYVNSDQVLKNYQAAIDASKKLEEESNKWGMELQKMQQQFKDSQDKLQQQSLLLSEAKKKEKAQEVQDLYVKIQQYQNQKWGQQGEYFKRQQELMGPIIQTINETIHKIGKDEGYDYIFDTVAGNVLFAKDKYDLTDKLLKELEKGAAAKPKTGGN